MLGRVEYTTPPPSEAPLLKGGEKIHFASHSGGVAPQVTGRGRAAERARYFWDCAAAADRSESFAKSSM